MSLQRYMHAARRITPTAVFKHHLRTLHDAQSGRHIERIRHSGIRVAAIRGVAKSTLMSTDLHDACQQACTAVTLAARLCQVLADSIIHIMHEAQDWHCHPSGAELLCSFHIWWQTLEAWLPPAISQTSSPACPSSATPKQNRHSYLQD